MFMLSVITPVYNGERFMEFCIKNIIEQNCPHAEHIIIDGNSTDNTVNIIKSYAEMYGHIRWVSGKDRGQSDAMNKGIEMAQGEIISFLNVDDFYEPRVLNRILEIFKTLPEPSFLVGNCNIWGDEGKIMYVNEPKSLKITDLLSGASPFPYNPSAYFYHKSLHQKIGFYKEDEHYMMDTDFVIKAVQAAKVKYVDEVWGDHRHIKGTKTITFQKQYRYVYLSRSRHLIKDHIKRLPMFQRCIVAVKHAIFIKLRYRRIQFYLEHPSKLAFLIQCKVLKKEKEKC